MCEPCPVTFCKHLCQPSSLLHFHPPLLCPLLPLPLSPPLATCPRIALYLPLTLQHAVCNYLCLCVSMHVHFGRYGLSTLQFVLSRSFPLSSPLLSSPPPPTSLSFLLADRPVHCSTSFPLRQCITLFRIHAAAAFPITILGPFAPYSEAIQIHAVWHVHPQILQWVFRC